MIDITDIIVAVIGLLATVLTAIAVPWLRGKLGEQRWNTLCEAAEVAVYAAEQLGMTEIVVDKLDYATAQVTKTLHARGIRYDDVTVRNAIEATVRRMKDGVDD